MTVPISGSFVGMRSQHVDMADTYARLEGEGIVHSYLEGGAMRMVTETFTMRETLSPLRPLIFIGAMGAESRAHMLHLGVDVAF